MRQKRQIVRNYLIYSDTSKLHGTDYVGVGSGRHTGKYVSKGYIFIEEDSFVVAEGIIKRHCSRYDHNEINNISRTKGSKVATDLRVAAESILACINDDILSLLEYKGDSSPKAVSEFIKQKVPISKMLVGLADYMDNSYENDEWICVLGVEQPLIRNW